MKKKKSIFIFMFLWCSSMNVFGQISDKAFFYSATYSSDSTDRNNLNTDFMVLWSGNNYSVFESYYRYQSDSFKTAVSNQSTNPRDLNMSAILGQMVSMKKPSFDFIIHKSWKEKEITAYNNLFFDNFEYTQPLKMDGWKIEDQYKEILGYKCQKASIHYAGRNFIAWYTEEIPLSDGPYVFNGLPGLILQLEDVQNYYRFELVGIRNTSIEMGERVLSKTISLPKEQFFLTKKSMYKDVRKALLGKPSSVSDEAIRDVQVRYDKKNNPLELVVGK
ncbi:GLPGLI family protein [Algoriphagus sp. D3-2-R+10]|uniref:GLPGLI family protein n=1 Tax=Algoriphagus aurantiacus TaxID=3103948 RepID=UPI002B3692CC|nr:GLPGLI family protein [Algoriphagus sp. D3-2-R+10]MEB2774546.1 GLPGLI family protein [Algoriphagus sp. D3-2-R+10]